MKSVNIIIFFFLVVGIIYRLYLTLDNNFLFNMDNARDLVDVREIVVLQKLRLIGPTSAIEGFYNGPAWYYLLAISFVFTGGNPYGAILMEIILWAIGGFFLLKLVSKYGTIPLIFTGTVWIYSNYIVLATLYSFNPNPVTLLTPLFIYLLKKYLETNKLIYSVSTWFLGGLFFNFEMNFGFFIPPIIIAAIIFSGKQNYLKASNFWLGSLFFIATLLPQVLFDLKHQFIMSSSIFRYLSNPEGGQTFNPLIRFLPMAQRFYQVFNPTFLNLEFLTKVVLIIITIVSLKFLQKKEFKKNLPFLIALIVILVPFLGYVLIPVTVNSWHLGAEAASLIILSGIALGKIQQWKIFGKWLSLFLCFFLVAYVLVNLKNDLTSPKQKSMDVSNFANELAAVDFIYQKSQGKNFKVYIYLPSIIDYPYQYLFWWRGLNKYGYTPKDYAYLPSQPPYISNKEKFILNNSSLEESGLIFLIKEPDRIKIRHLWENSFKHLPLLETNKVGPIEIETRKELSR